MLARDILHPKPLAVRIWKRVARQQSAAEAVHNPGCDSAYLACADYTHGSSMQIETQQPVEGEIAFAHASVGAVYLAVERQYQSYRMLSHRIRRISRDAGHNQP